MPSENGDEEIIVTTPDTPPTDKSSITQHDMTTENASRVLLLQSNTSAKILIRKATFQDLQAISRILTAAFWDEDAVGRAAHPKRARFPDDVRRYWLRRMRSSVLHWAHELIVAVDTDSKEVRGVADWWRMGPGSEKARGKGLKWVLRRVIEKGVKVTNATGNWLRPNRAADPVALTAFTRALPFFTHFWEGPRADAFALTVLGVDPDCQGQGVGRQLVAWGLDKADVDGIASSVISAAGREKFYMRCGYEEIVGNVTHGEGNPLAGVRGGDILFKDRKEVRDVKNQVADGNGSTEVL